MCVFIVMSTFIYERALAEIIPDKLIQVISKCIP